jgi:hypothetical protein
MIDGLDGRKRSISKFQKCFGASQKNQGKENNKMKPTEQQKNLLDYQNQVLNYLIATDRDIDGKDDIVDRMSVDVATLSEVELVIETCRTKHLLRWLKQDYNIKEVYQVELEGDWLGYMKKHEADREYYNKICLSINGVPRIVCAMHDDGFVEDIDEDERQEFIDSYVIRRLEEEFGWCVSVRKVDLPVNKNMVAVVL